MVGVSQRVRYDRQWGREAGLVEAVDQGFLDGGHPDRPLEVLHAPAPEELALRDSHEADAREPERDRALALCDRDVDAPRLLVDQAIVPKGRVPGHVVVHVESAEHRIGDDIKLVQTRTSRWSLVGADDVAPALEGMQELLLLHTLNNALQAYWTHTSFEREGSDARGV